MDEQESLKKKALELYIRVKEMYLLAEETMPGFIDFLQPVFEINRGFDHLSRVLACEINIKKVEKPKYYKIDNLQKSIGHFYRAYFDITDWLSMNLRSSIIDTFRKYSHECIRDVAPEYYTKIRPEINSISRKIAKIRNKKDVGDLDTISLMEKYENILNDLENKIEILKDKIPAMIEYDKKIKRKNRKKIIIQIIIGLFLLLAGIFIKDLYNKYISNQSNQIKPAQKISSIQNNT